MAETPIQRRARLNEKFKDLIGWDASRIREKEDDGSRLSEKLTNIMKHILENTSLIALSDKSLTDLDAVLTYLKSEVDLEKQARV